MAVGTKTVEAPAVGAGAGASAAETVTEKAETTIIITSIAAKSFIVFKASMKLLCDSVVDGEMRREKKIAREKSREEMGFYREEGRVLSSYLLS